MERLGAHEQFLTGSRGQATDGANRLGRSERGTAQERLEALLAAAVRAPSGDNTQPWRFRVDPEAGTVALEVDPTRDRSPMNAGQRMARIAVGAALENLLRVARGHGWQAELVPESPAPALAVVRLRGGDGDGVRPGADVLAGRVTNRRPYDGRPVPAAVLDRLGREAPDRDGVATRWITGADRFAALADVIGRADATMFGEPSMRRAFLTKVRLDADPATPVAEGLCAGSLELTRSDQWALRMMPRLPDRLLRLAGVGRVFAAKARQLVTSSSGLCLIVAWADDVATDLAVGRAMQRAWLALTAEGLAAQPIMSLAVLENAWTHGTAALIASLGPDRLRALDAGFRALVPELAGGRPAVLMRFGYAPPPSGRTGRLPLPAVLAPEATRPGGTP